MYNNNKLQVYDKNMQKLTFITNAEFSTELGEKTVLYDEIIINILLSISPRKIIIHEAKIDKKNKEATNTIDVIKKIFENKVEICKGCKYCEFL